MEILSSAGAAVAFLSAALLFSRKAHQPADGWLALGYVISGLLVLSFAVLSIANESVATLILAIAASLFLLPGPIQTLYLMRLTRAGNLPNWSYALFLPFALGLGLYGAIAFGLFPETRLTTQSGLVGIAASGSTLLVPIGAVITLAHLAYPIVGLRALNRSRTRLKALWSSYATVNVSWLRQWLWATIALIAVGSSISVLNLWIGAIPLTYTVAALQIAIIIQLFWFAYHGLQQTNLFSKDGSATTAPAPNDKEQAAIINAVDAAMELNQLFRQPRLRLTNLEDATGKPAEQISAALRMIHGQSFYEYVNSWRIRFITDELTQQRGEKVNLLRLAYDAGFNSKSAFNRVFQLHVGVTPSKFHRQGKK